jgi:NADPH-dependent glutamate synthase beta subunit-like oxidoreductase/Pyruvate/2-oxoacid:ferredoxin oxidoreductase delta subunit
MKTIPRHRQAPPVARGAAADPASSLQFHTGSWRQERPRHHPRVAPCRAACPAGEDPQAYLALLQQDRWRQAWEVLVAVNPLPAVTGRVCPHPCERECNRGRYDEPLAIHSVERELGDAALRESWAYPSGGARGPSARVAIVGSGPAGLSAAYHLKRLGHRPTIFEAQSEPGGLLRSAIPPYRLPRDVLDAEIGRVLDLGIELRARFRLGRDAALDELRSDFDAVLLAVGAQKCRAWDVSGAVPADQRGALEVLKEWVTTGSLSVPRRAVVHGGGNTAVDLARVLRHLGAEVDVVCASAMPGSGAPLEDTMSALAREVGQALEEGVRFHEHSSLGRLILHAGRVSGVELVRLKKLPSAGGGTRRVSFEGTETVLAADRVFPATGEVVDPRGLERLLAGGPFLRHGYWGEISGEPGLYVAGDARGDCGFVAAAVSQGRQAAVAIDHAVGGRELPAAAPAPDVLPFERLHLRYFDHAGRSDGPVLPVEGRDLLREVEGGLDRPALMCEVHRCFSCGSCLACDNCWTLCPDSAVLKMPEPGDDGAPYVFDLEYCKGCGICAEECPPGFIEMVPERSP